MKTRFWIAALFLCTLFSCGREKPPPEVQEQGQISDAAPLVSRGDVVGQVTLKDQEEHGGIIVYVPGTSYVGFTNTEGSFLLQSLEPGEYEVFAWKEGFSRTSLGEVSVGEKPTTVLPPTVLEPLERAETGERGTVVGLVSLEGETSFEGVVVELRGTWFRTVTDSSGVYRFVEVPASAYEVVFKKSGFTERVTTFEVQGGKINTIEKVELTAVMRKPTKRTIYGNLEMLDAQGEYVNRFQEAVVALEGTNYVAVPDGWGRFQFTNVAPGKYTIVTHAPGFKSRDKVEVDLTDLEFTNVTMVLEEDTEVTGQGGTVRGVAVYKVDGVEDHSGIQLGLLGTSYMALTDEPGNYEIREVSPGEYGLLAFAPGFQMLKVEPIIVEEGNVVQLDKLELEPLLDYPEVVFTSPADGEKDVSVKREVPVFVRFSKKMRPDLVKSAVSVTPQVSHKLFMGKEHAQSDFDLLLILMEGVAEEAPVSFATSYKITVGTEAQDFDGLQLQEPYSFSFMTGEAEIVGTYPYSGETRAIIDPRRPLRVYFNAPLDYETVDASSISSSPRPFAELSVLPIDSPESGWTEIQVYGKFEDDTEYTITVGSGIKTRDGSSIKNTPYSFSFKTAKLLPYPK